MKNIFINNPKIVRDEESSEKLKKLFENRFGYSAFYIEGTEVFSDIGYDEFKNVISRKQEKTMDALIQYSAFIGEYINQILFENETAEKRKSSPYSIFVSLTVDFQYSKARIHFYLDGDIFGLVAGSGYSNITSFIRTSFPIFSKIGADVEVKLFSLSENKLGHSSFSEDEI